jgi:hypothetical protein
VVENTGGYDLENIVLVDDPGGTITCPFYVLAIGDDMECEVTETAENLSDSSLIGNCSGTPNMRLFQNTATVTAQTSGGEGVMDMNTSHYCNPDAPRPDLIFESGFE